MEVFMIDLNENQGNIQEVMNVIQDKTAKYIQELAKTLKVSEDCALDVWYLRSRSRWTRELEDELIQLHKEGKAPNMCEFE